MAPAAHRHVVLTIPKVLQGLFTRDRSLLGLLARAAWHALRRLLEEAFRGLLLLPPATTPGRCDGWTTGCRAAPSGWPP